jgi:hypothetical protein
LVRLLVRRLLKGTGHQEGPMKKIVGFALALALGIGFSGTAHAGGKSINPVTVAPSAGYAYGSLGSTRNSSDVISYLVAIHLVSGSNNSAELEARDANGNTGYCWTTNPPLVEAISRVVGDSFVYFTWSSSTNECLYMQVVSSSQYEPKAQ